MSIQQRIEGKTNRPSNGATDNHRSGARNAFAQWTGRAVPAALALIVAAGAACAMPGSPQSHVVVTAQDVGQASLAPSLRDPSVDGRLPYYADEDGAGYGYVGDGFGHRINGFASRDDVRSTDHRLPYYADEDGAGYGYVGDGFGHRVDGFASRDEAHSTHGQGHDGQPDARTPASAQEPGRFEVTNMPNDYQVASLLLDFPAGAWTPPHTHGGQGYLTVIDGEMTLRMAGLDHQFRAGEGWVDRADVVHEAGNATTSQARLVATYLLPRGAPLTSVQQQASQQPPPGPTTLANVRHDPKDVPTGPLDVFQRVIAFEPGQQMSVHSHPGPLFATVVEGEIEMHLPDGVQTFRAGDTWIEPVDALHTGSNSGSTRALVVFVALLPRSAPMTIPAPSGQGVPAPAQDPRQVALGSSGTAAAVGIATGAPDEAAPALIPESGDDE